MPIPPGVTPQDLGQLLSMGMMGAMGGMGGMEGMEGMPDGAFDDMSETP